MAAPLSAAGPNPDPAIVNSCPPAVKLDLPPIMDVMIGGAYDNINPGPELSALLNVPTVAHTYSPAPTPGGMVQLANVCATELHVRL